MPRRPATDSDEVPLRELGAAGDLEAFVDALLALYDHRGRAHYDEIVTQREHALQAALQAAEAGHDDQLIAAALLHDVGHLLDSEAAHATKDLSHEGRGADLLALVFPESVTEPIRLHVLAKRWLCGTDPSYAKCLSPASRRTLELQGAALTGAEASALSQHAGLARATALRRLDDRAKVHNILTPPLAAWRDLLLRVGTTPGP